MSWSDLPSSHNDSCHVGQEDCGATNVFDDNADSTFHRDHSLLMNHSVAKWNDFSDIADFSFREIENLFLEDYLRTMNNLIRNQVSIGQNDYNIKLINERSLKNMKAVDINYQMTFNNNFFPRKKKKMNEVKDILKNAYENMIDSVKNDLRPGDIMRADIHNANVDLPIYVACRPVDEVNAEVMMESTENVLNSNEDLPFTPPVA